MKSISQNISFLLPVRTTNAHRRILKKMFIHLFMLELVMHHILQCTRHLYKSTTKILIFLVMKKINFNNLRTQMHLNQCLPCQELQIVCNKSSKDVITYYMILMIKTYTLTHIAFYFLNKSFMLPLKFVFEKLKDSHLYAKRHCSQSFKYSISPAKFYRIQGVSC